MTMNSTHLRYGVVYLGVVVGAVSVFTFFNPSVGTRVLLALVVIGGVTYIVCDSDNRSRQSHARRYPDGSSHGQKSHFEREAVDMNRGPLTGRALLLGAGLCFFATVVLAIFYMMV